MTDEPYNPLDKKNLGRSVADALLIKPVIPLSNVKSLAGAGVYAIYYTGDFQFYRPIADSNREGKFAKPIYVGKAVPRGARKGGMSFNAASGTAMKDRLRTHAKSIDETENLDLNDFHCRALMVDDIWIPLGENMMIEEFRPVWNLVIDGFGNKTPGRRRYTQHLSSWDILHPGRKFAANLAKGNTTVEMVTNNLAAFLAGRPAKLVSPEDAVDEGNDADE